jgi:glutamyl-tRNA reductase
MEWLSVGMVGISFKTAELSVRDAIARATIGLTGEASLFFEHRTVVLSTCNRTEIYFSADDLAEAHSDLLRFLRREIKDPFEHRLYSTFSSDCLLHLCRVAAGLDSAIIAETEIQGQVKRAYSEAMHLPSSLHFLFQRSLQISKEVRRRLPLVRGVATLYGLLLDIIREQGDISKMRFLFVGYSDTNRQLIAYLKNKGAYDLCSRHDEVLSRWEEYDVIICASTSPHSLIHPKSITKKCLIFDLSIPRNVDPVVGTLPFVSLFNMAELHGMIQETEGEKKCRVDGAIQLIREKVLKLRMSRTARERDDVPDVLHAGHK